LRDAWRVVVPEPKGRFMNVRESLGSDHQAIERKLDQLSDAVEGADFPTILEVFRGIDLGLRAHIDGEERYLFDRFEGSHPDVIGELRAEHQRARQALDELMIQTELHTLRKESIDGLVAQLRAHAAKENQTLYAWADESTVEEQRNGLYAFLEERRMTLREQEAPR
jgi:hemerythrin-like domain-containing protein